jgi:membrane protease YdiL (CAAX protease family)
VTRAAVVLWSTIAGGTALAAATLALEPPAPAATVGLVPAASAGVVAAAVLVTAVGRSPGGRRPPLRGRVRLAKHAFIALWAVNEELVWRRLVLGESLRAGAMAAATISTVAFAVAHRARQPTHLVTGAAFSGLYVATGTLVAPIVAHWGYNALLALRIDRAPAPREVPS